MMILLGNMPGREHGRYWPGNPIDVQIPDFVRARSNTGAGYGRESMTIDWNTAFAQRVSDRGDAEITAILAGVPEGVLALTGGFPNPRTFPSAALDELVAEMLRGDAEVALQYAPSEGLP